jgi:hypothetical protein
VGEGGKPLWEAEEEVHYVIGSGTRGHSYFHVRDDRIYFSPISWYSQASKWDGSPGGLDSYILGRPVPGECVFCHTNQADAVEGSLNR